ncbi:ATP-binding protein [Candidatus Pacearchaeota archaeon]|nr:ATP-binding protein [Candidatus Pacearchaeota archaeon]
MIQEIKDILLLQKRELESRLRENYVERETELKLNNNIIKVIVGPRRAGKSFFAIHFLNKRGEFGYVNFDDEKLIDIKNYDELIEAMNSVYNNPKFVLFDEIQNLSKWELFVNRLQRQGFNLIITGSNSKMLSKELATHLTGRHFPIHISPFSFKEYIRLEKKELTTAEIKEKFSKYLIYGGYPEPLVKSLDIKEYLSILFDSIIFKDIIKRYRIRNPKEIEDMAFYLMSNIANEYSYHSLTKTSNVKSSHTVEKYLGYLEETFILFSLNRFSYKVREQLSSNKKIYCIDNGFIYSKAFTLSPDYGKLYENLVAIELKKKEMFGKLHVYFWKNQQQEEVDFVIKERAKVKQLIQVCFNIKNRETKKREVRALLKASRELKCNNLLIITEDYEAEVEEEWFGIKEKIKFISLWKWLKEKDKF